MQMKECLGSVLTSKPEEHPGFNLSVSKIKTFKTCAAQYRFNYIDRLPKKTRDYHTYGKFTHEILETFHQKKIDGSKLSNGALMNKCFESACESFKDNLTAEQKQEGFDTMLVYLDKISDKNHSASNQVVGVEESFWVDIDDKVLLRGFIDRTQMDSDGWFHVADYKTSKKGKYRKTKAPGPRSIIHDLQLRCYAKVVQKEFGVPAENIKAALYYLEGGNLIGAKFSQESLDAAEEVMLNAYNRIEAKDPDKVVGTVGPHCTRCDYRSICPFYKAL